MELIKGAFKILCSIVMIPIFFFMAWTWDGWAKLWKKSFFHSFLFLITAPFMLFFGGISYAFAQWWG